MLIIVFLENIFEYFDLLFAGLEHLEQRPPSDLFHQYRSQEALQKEILLVMLVLLQQCIQKQQNIHTLGLSSKVSSRHIFQGLIFLPEQLV